MRLNLRARYGSALALVALSLSAAFIIAGCTGSIGPDSASATVKADVPIESKTPDTPGTVEDTEGHGHKPGSHGGIIVSIGSDSYHAEAVFEQGGVLKLFTLGQDESRIVEIESQKLTAYIKPTSGTEAIPVDLVPSPQDGDAEGKTSQFVAQIPADLVGQELEVTIPNVRINGERFRLGFTSRPAEHAEESSMPASVSAAEEQELYLTPGGKYTLADIAANGNVTASQKFKGIVSSHDLKPKAGDRICPVTLTKANSKFTWVIDGQEYEFCCPPCVDEFVKLAKQNPDDLQPAASFVKP